MREYADLIGVPFAYGGRGPDSYDCFGLVRELYRREHGVLLPDHRSPEVQEEQHARILTCGMLDPHWVAVPRQGGTVAAVQLGRLVSHCVYMLDAHTMIHAWDRAGGVHVVSDMREWDRRIVGFYRYAG